MSTKLLSYPVYMVVCDRAGCARCYTSNHNDTLTEWRTRDEARRAGWSLRPNRGKGSKSAPDLCPACAPRGAAT